MKDTGVAYLLFLGGNLFCLSGLHRFYLGRPVSGAIWLVTWGLLGFGNIFDLFYIPTMVEEANGGRRRYQTAPANVTNVTIVNQVGHVQQPEYYDGPIVQDKPRRIQENPFANLE